MNKKEIIEIIDKNSAEIVDISHSIWEFAELSLKETESAALYVEKLKESNSCFNTKCKRNFQNSIF